MSGHRKKASEVTIPVTLILPQMPNFIGVVGMSDHIAVGQLTPDQAEEFAEAWKRAFLDHCANRRAVIDSKLHFGPG
jgi:hypothetical protein